ncbi:MAG: ferredoxin [Flavobacteriales bacterium]
MNFFKKIFRHSSTEKSNHYFLKDRPRHPLNVSGDFYVEKDSCILCGAPEVEASGLMEHSNDGCYFVRQPQTDEEIEHAISAIAVSCVSAVRYGGTELPTKKWTLS